MVQVYCPKAAKKDRNAGLPEGQTNNHSTVKPHALMRWLCRLIGHPEGRLLDPFAGSGSTLRAARAEGLPCDGIERDHHYCVDLAAPRA
ncbi:MAG: site-specific DNA-methyltransferase, partial [Desulfurellales bacterium]